MPTTEKYTLGTTATLITTGGSSATNTLCRGAAFDNTQGGGGGDGYTLCDLEFAGSWTVAPAANTGVAFWFLGNVDGTNYEDGDGSVSGGTDVLPQRPPDCVFPARAVT